MLRRGSALWPNWRRYALLGLLGVGCYNALQYLALKTSTPINVTLVASSTPVLMLGMGALFFGQRISRRQLLGAALSIAGVAGGAVPRRPAAPAAGAAGAGRPLRAAGHRGLGLLQLAAGRARATRRTSAATGPLS